MEQNLLLIKEFGQLTGLSRKSLYHYEQLGILKPTYVDPENNYRYYHPNLLLLAKRIRLLKEADFSLREMEQIINQRLSIEQMNLLIQQKHHAKQREIENAQKVIEHLDELARPIEVNSASFWQYVHPVWAYELQIDAGENICLALNQVELLLKSAQEPIENERFITYKIEADQVNPIRIAVPTQNPNAAKTGVVKYFGFHARQFFIEVNPYHEESERHIRQILASDFSQKRPAFVYERILNTDDYLFTPNRLSTLLFPN